MDAEKTTGATTTGLLVGHAIVRLRRQQGLSVQQLAELSGVGRTTLVQLEQGRIAMPRASTVQRLAHVLGVPVEQLWPSESERQDVFGESVATDRGGRPIDRPRTSWTAPNHRLDAISNQRVNQLAEREPLLFQGFLPSDWTDLQSRVGVGGGMTDEGVRQAALRIRQNRLVIQQLQAVLETHLRETAIAVVESLHRTVQIRPPSEPAE